MDGGRDNQEESQTFDISGLAEVYIRVVSPDQVYVTAQ